MEANPEKSSLQNRGITPSSSPKPIILNNNDFKPILFSIRHSNIHTLHSMFFKSKNIKGSKEEFQQINCDGINKNQKLSRVRLPRARLAVSKQAGVEPFEGPQQQGFGQNLIHCLLAGEGGVTLIHGAEGEVIGEGLGLFVWMPDNSLLTVHEDDLQCLLCLLPTTEQKHEQTLFLTWSLSTRTPL